MEDVKKSHNEQDLERVADTSKTIIVEKEVYEAVLRNSVKVADLEAENMQLRQFCEEFNALNVAEENHRLKELLEECGIFLDVHLKNDGNVFINDVSTSQMIDKINEALK